MLENAVYQAEKMKTDYKDKLSEEDLKTLQEAVDEAKTHLEATDKDELEKAAKELSDKIMPIGAKMYEAAQAEEKNDESAAEGKSKKKSDREDPIEGEVVEDEGQKEDK
jgi:molecular chaperone DnaK